MVNKIIKVILLVILFISSVATQTTFDASTQITMSVPNNPIAGTTLNKLVTIDASGTAVTSGTSDTNIPTFIVVQNSGTSGNAKMATIGAVLCTFDAAGGTAQHFVQASSTAGGSCHDAGATKPTSGWLIGQLLSSPGANANGVVLLTQSSGGLPAGTADGKIPIWNDTSKQWEALDPLMQGTQAAGSSTQPNPLGFGGWDYTNGVLRNLAVDPTSKALLTVLPPQPLLNVTDFTDVTAASPTRGDIITAQGASSKWTRFAKGAVNQCVSMDASAIDVAWQPCYNAANTSMGTGSVPSGAGTGYLYASLNSTQGILYLGSDGLGVFKRNTNQFELSFDGLSTIPYIFGATGFSSTRDWTTTGKITASQIEGVLEADKNGFIGDGTTDNTANFNSLVSLACAGGYRTIYVPQGNYVFKSKPNNIPCGISWISPFSGGAAYGWGTFFTITYNEATPTNGFITYDGANSNTQGNGGGMFGINILVDPANTAGAIIKLMGTSCTARAGFNLFFDMKLGGGGGGNASYGILIDGSSCTTSGTQGLRDTWVSSVYTFGTTVAAIKCINCVHFYAANLATSPGTGVGDIIVTGNGSGTQASNDVALSAVSVTGNLTVDQASQIVYYGVVTGTASCTANTLTTELYGDIGTVTGCKGYLINDSVTGGSRTNNLRADGYLIAGPAVPSNATTGDLISNNAATGGNVKLGSDGNMIIRRNNGSGAGSQLAFTFDAFGTTPLTYDNVNGGATVLPFNKTGQADIVTDSSAINTTDTIIVKTPALVANRLVAGTHIRATLTGTCTSTIANASTFTLRWGTNGTTADGTVAALVTNNAATSGTNNGFKTVIDFTVRVAGASATSDAFMETISDANIGISATPSEKFVAGTAFNTTTASAIFSISYKSAATTTTSTFKTAVIEIVQN